MCNSRPNISHEVNWFVPISPVAWVQFFSQPFGPRVAAKLFSENPRPAGRRVNALQLKIQTFGNVRS